ncbi:hypothetical protein [Bacillus subtilis]|uniref:hypothetical protein n=1 Tax=Bacillus subtilis TaxID=1423 RepID=UPI0011AD1FAE|nr:hypothetical protein [Bacillus subtilis]TWG82535.1 hypothetical protein L604_001300000240 [Bacillus subtilis J27]
MKVPNHIGIFFVYGVIKSPLGVHDLSPKTSCNLVVVAMEILEIENLYLVTQAFIGFYN